MSFDKDLQNTVIDALNYLPSDNYEYWIKIGMAIKLDFPNNEGLTIFDNWSQKSQNYKGFSDVEKHWKYFDSSKGGNQITLNTIFSEASQRDLNFYENHKQTINRYKYGKSENDIKKNNFVKIPDIERAPRENFSEAKNTKKDKTYLEFAIDSLNKSLNKENGAYSEVINKSHATLLEKNNNGFKYIGEREISLNTVEHFKVGYIKDFQYFPSKKRGVGSVSEAIIIPNSINGYIARNIASDNLVKYSKPKGFKNGGKGVDIPVGFLQILEQDKDKKHTSQLFKEPVFIVEGSFDCMALYEVNKTDSIALNGVNSELLIDLLKHFEVDRPLILALDNDKAGQNAQRNLYQKLLQNNFIVIEADKDIYLNCKDFNEALIKDRALFHKQVEKNKKRILENGNISQLENYKKHLINKNKESGIKTGFNSLDNQYFLDGGLKDGLIIIGAVSSTGKTTFCLQIANNIAKQNPVLFFSLEMSSNELRDKSISAFMFSQNENKAQSLTELRKNYIKNGSINETIENSINDYFETTQNLNIIEGIGDIGVKEIKEQINKFIKITDSKPVVFIDYLQILQPPKDSNNRRLNLTDKQIVDYNVLELKKISRDLDLPIVVISSFNRDNYNNPLNLKAFKEAGSIEYSSDVLIGLEPSFMEYTDKNSQQIKEQDYKTKYENKKANELILKVLKNRNGIKGNLLVLDYYPKYNYFVECDLPEVYTEELRWKNIS